MQEKMTKFMGNSKIISQRGRGTRHFDNPLAIVIAMDPFTIITVFKTNPPLVKNSLKSISRIFDPVSKILPSELFRRIYNYSSIHGMLHRVIREGEVTLFGSFLQVLK